MRKDFIAVIALLILSLTIPLGFSQVKEDKEERSIAIKRSLDEQSKFSSRVAVFSGYDSNPVLGTLRKSDSFQEFLYSLNFSKPLSKDSKFTLDYDLDFLNYNEMTDFTNILNHINLGLHNKLGECTLGAGYDLGVIYYPRNDDSNFLFHRGFLYARHDITAKTYQRLGFGYGFKDYMERKALDAGLGTIKDDKRFDKRWNADYSLTSILSPRLLVSWQARYALNDSNVAYIDFHDYKSYQTALKLYYKLFKRLNLLSSFSYRRKDYDERMITGGTSRQKDDLYSAMIGLVYRLNKRNSLSLNYTYRQNSSNDPFEEYIENLITTGYRYDF